MNLYFMKHRKIYREHFGLGPDDFAPCEVSGGRGSDVHHIFGRVKCEAWDTYGITHADDIHNLMFLSRDIHQWAGQNEFYNEWLMKIHLGFLDDGITGFAREPYAEESRRLQQQLLEKLGR